ncbi:MAG: carboxymuconolactone decarboxylase family protein [Candidatus Competibacterales bacterium]|nr:carboxymuconolactone decarboxylase family protein [Candidatus Competibacterales bacterium]
MASDAFRTGLKIRKEVLGKAYVEQALSGATEFDHDYQRMLVEHAWGGIWGRGVLSNQQRSLNMLCMLAAQGRMAEFKLHLRGALRNGCSLEELRETLLQIAVYCGMPAGNEAFRLAREVFAEEGVEVSPRPVEDGTTPR